MEILLIMAVYYQDFQLLELDSYKFKFAASSVICLYCSSAYNVEEEPTS